MKPALRPSRRQVLKASAALAGAEALSPLASFAASPGEAAAPRQVLPLLSGWRFFRGDAASAEATGFDDRAWQAITLPHNFPYRWPAQPTPNLPNGAAEFGGQYYRGLGWYRLRLRLPASLAAPPRSYFLQFDGAATVADVFVNGTRLGQHRGNFAAFCFDATSALKPGADNLIAVRVDNRWHRDVPPLAGDFNIYGGLYREARLLALAPVSISPLDHASPGIYILQRRVDRSAAQLALRAVLRNASSAPAAVSLEWIARDHAGGIVARARARRRLAPKALNLAVTTPMRIPRPRLWQGRDHPYLYRVELLLRNASGTLLDRVEQNLGLRSFTVTPDAGFRLNGQPYPLHGVNMHQDRPGLGRAVPYALLAGDLDPLVDMGATSLRLPHYQHAQPAYDAADRLGIVVWTELGLVNRVIASSPAFAANARRQLRELIKQNFNHPSVCFWSLYNELAFAYQGKRGLEAAALLEADAKAGKITLPWALLFDLQKLAKQLDPSRLTTAATAQAALHPINFITDVICYNRYFGWYDGTPGDWPSALDRIRRRVARRDPQRALGISEYGAGASIRQHEFPVRQPNPGGDWHPEEWQCIVHEAAWEAMRRRPWLWNTLLWVLYDFASSGRHEGDRRGENDKGLISFDRGIRKDAFYFYQAQWSPRPMLHLNGSRFSPRPAGAAAFKAYSNCAQVELLLDGVSLGVKSGQDRVFTWPLDYLAAGRHRLEARARAAAGRRLRDRYTFQAGD